MKVHEHIFGRIVAPENLFAAWEVFRCGKATRPDVAAFERRLEEHVFSLHRDLVRGAYRHGPYEAFAVRDPKPRHIHKASVRDRLLHHALVRVLEPVFDPTFIAHSYSCRKGKGTHRAVAAVHRMLRGESRNGTRPCHALQCDVARFFASVDQGILLGLLGSTVRDAAAMALLAQVVGSFPPAPRAPGMGMPLGNLTSQLFANVYLHELDMFVKHTLRVRRYARYTDDFVVVSRDAGRLLGLVGPIEEFLSRRLRLRLHPAKVRIRKFRQGIDFLGYVLLPHHRVVRTKTRRRMLGRLGALARECAAGRRDRASFERSLCSYLGVLSHADTHRLRQDLRNTYGCWLQDRPSVP